MAVVSLGFYEPDGTTLIGTLTDDQLIECEVRPALMELGAIRFVVSRHLAAASSALLAKGNIVKVTYPVIDADPICVFVLKDDVSQLIDDDEEGGEHLEVRGPGGVWLLQHARLREEVYAPGQPARGDWDDDISWNWRNRAYGAILVRAIEEGQNQPGNPLSAITIDFDRDVDSNAVPWATIAEDFSVPIGTDVLSLADRLAAAGDLFLVLTPDMVLHAYQTYGRDLTGAFAADNVRFEKGVNVLTELSRKTELDRVTHLITRDMDAVYRTYVTPDAFDQAVYGFLDIDWTNDEPQIEKTALSTLSSSDNAAERYTVEVLPGDDPEGGEYLPGPLGTDGHFWPGDDVTMHTGTGGHDLNAAAAKVTAVSIILDIAADDSDAAHAARSLHIVPELVIGTPAPALSGVGNSPGANGVNCICLRLCAQVVGIAPTFVASAWNAEEQGGAGVLTVPAGLIDACIFIAVPSFLGTTFPPASVDWNGQAATLYGSLAHPTQGGIALYYILNPTPGGSNLNTSNGNGILGGWLYEGVNQASPVASWSAVTGTSATAAATLAAVSGQAPIAAMVVDDDDFSNDSQVDPVPAAGMTADWSEVQQAGTPGFRDMEYAGGHGDWSASWTLDETHPWTAFVAAIRGSVSIGDLPQPVGANDEGAVGIAKCAAHGDHVHAHSDLSDHADEIHHHADSIEGLTPGLGAWQTFSPTFSTSGGGGALGDGTLVGRWREMDATMAYVSIHLTWGSTSNAGTGNFQIGGLPFTVRTGTPLIQVLPGVLIDSGTASFVAMGRLTQGTTAMNLTVVADAAGTRHAAAGIPIVWATGDQIIVQGLIETD